MNKFCTFAVAVIVAAFLFSVPQPVEAASAAQYRAYGNQLYKQKQYSKALQYYEASYKLQPDPQLNDFIQKLRVHVHKSASPGAAPGEATAKQVSSESKSGATESGSASLQYGAQLLVGYATYAFSDFNADADWQKASAADDADQTVDITVGSGGISFGAEGLVFLPIGLGLGVGFISEGGGKYEGVFEDTNGGTSTDREETSFEVSQTRIPISLHYRKNLTPSFSLGGNVGIDLVSMTATMDFHSETVGVSGSGFDMNGEFNSSGTGFHLGLDGAYSLTSNISLVLGFGYYIAKLTDFEGSITASGITFEGVVPTMATETDPAGERMDFHAPAFGPMPVDERPLEIDSTGLRVLFAVRALFP